jgi:hypothetical protein
MEWEFYEQFTINKHNYINNKPYVFYINSHLPHTKELA